MRSVSFEVLGIPAPQGSKSGFVVKGKAVLVEGGSKSGRQAHKTWRSEVAEAAKLQREQLESALTGPLHLTVTFRFAMPASRPAKLRRVVAFGAGIWRVTKPDFDKIVRSTCDSFKTAGLIGDDAQICSSFIRKVEVIGWTGASIRIQELDPFTAVPLGELQ